jgi:cell division protein FtsB
MKRKQRAARWIIILLALTLLVSTALSHNQKESQLKQIRQLEEQQTRDSQQIEKEHQEKLKLEQEKEQLKKQLETKKQKETMLAQVKPRYSNSGNCETYRNLIAQYSWNVNTMIAICNAESGGDPNKANTTDNHGVCMGSYGLFQISCHQGIVLDPTANVAAAWGKYTGAQNNPRTNYWGYWPWSVCKNGTLTCS